MQLRLFHPNTGRRQLSEHIERRVAAIASTRAQWSSEKDALYRKRAGEAAKQRPKSVYEHTPLFRQGHTPWNKGNNWRDSISLEEYRAITARRARERRVRNPGRRLHERISALVRYSLKDVKGGRSWEAILGYSRETLMAHLEAQFTEGMSWENIAAWHIDHVIPRSAFSFQRDTDPGFRACWALNNLQPLWAADNLKKRANSSTAQEGSCTPSWAIPPGAINPSRERRKEREYGSFNIDGTGQVL